MRSLILPLLIVPLPLPLLLLLVLGATPSESVAQTLKLEALQFPPSSVVGPWVSYRVRTQNRALAPREYTQRVAIVGRDKHRGQDGFWVELKTEGLPSGKLIERGFFIVVDIAAENARRSGELAELPPDSLPKPEPPSVRLVRYQVLTSGGKLYEYPVSNASEARAGSDVSTVELFEYDTSTAPVVEELGPDTLRIGRRIVPSIVTRTRINGADQWVLPKDKSHANRPLLTQTFWRNPAVPITGFAKSHFQVTMERVPMTLPDSGASADSGLTRPSLPPPDAAAAPDSTGLASQPITSTELTLLDLGADAVPEVTQLPEESPPPADDSPGTLR